MQHDTGYDALASHVPRGTLAQLTRYTELLRDAALQHNLIAASTMPDLWQRHIADAYQLIDLAPAQAWLDIGSGAGLPGIVIAIATGRPVTLVEPRAKRAAFLRDVAASLMLDAVTVVQSRVETLARTEAAIFCARAVAPLDRLFAMAHHLATPETVWVLPKGRGAAEELAAAKVTWHGDFRLVPSQTDSHASILVARDVRRRK